MRLGFDATPIREGKTGIGHHAELLVRGLAAGGGLEEIILLSNRRPVFDGEQPAGTRWPGRHTFPSRAVWMQTLLPRLLREERPDLVHYINFTAPLVHRHAFVVTFHDMSVFLHPEFFTWKKRVLTRRMMPRIAGRARRILTVTEAAKREIVEILGLPPAKVAVVNPAPGAGFAPPESREAVETVLARHAVPRPYILFLGTLEPRKNLAGLLQAFDRLKDGTSLPHHLVVGGGRGWKYAPIFETVEALRHKESVRFLDYVPLADLPALYAGADLFVFPSFYEGFGMPPVEAMRCGAPVLVSDIPPHREVGGDAVIAVDPHDPGAIAEGMRRVLEDPDLAGELRRRGFARGSGFTWERAAREALQVYREALGG